MKNPFAWAVVVATLPLLLGAKGCGSSSDARAGAGGNAGDAGGVSTGGSQSTGGSGAVASTGVDWPEQEGIGEDMGAAFEGPSAPSAVCLEVNPNQTARLLDFVPSDANAEGSAILAREALTQNRSPIPVHLRTQELLKHYAPKLSFSNTATSYTIQLRQDSDIPELFELLVAVQAPTLTTETRPQVALTLVVDTSASVLPVQDRTKAAITALAGALRPGDIVNWVTNDPEDVQTGIQITGPDDAVLVERADALLADVAEDLTPLDALVAKGYEIAQAGLVADAWNRVVVITDGDGELTTSTHSLIKEAAMTNDVLALAVGVGKALERSPRIPRLLSHAGRGPYIQLDGTDASSLKQRFIELVGKSFEDLRVSLSLPWFFEVERPYAFDSTGPDLAERQYLAPGQVVVFPFRLLACDVNALDDTATLSFTITLSGAEGDATVTATATLGDLRKVSLANAELGHVFAVLAYAEALRTMDSLRLTRAHQLVTASNTAQDPGLNEIAQLITQHPAYSP